MTSPLLSLVGPSFAAAFDAKGYSELTLVQQAVLEPALQGRDLRISSQTGSGKTVAIGLALRSCFEGEAPASGAPRALVIAPTRELAKQVEAELGWLYAPQRIRVACLTGGASYVQEQRALSARPGIVVGTPGRLLDHLKRGSFQATEVRSIVLDEADRMLDMGFREDLEAILEHAPKQRSTHLVSATFPSEVLELADRVQNDPARVQGTRLGVANADIEHLVHVVDPNEQLDAIVNLLLAYPEEQVLVFARTRVEVAELARDLADAGFAAMPLSGEMEQRQRDRALGAFRRGELRLLVATDVAARGIDVQDIARVIHVGPPSDADTYTHRSGRTGRAGRKGTSSLIVAPAAVGRTTSLLRRTSVRYRFEPIPSAEAIERSAEDRAFERLTGESAGDATIDERTWQMAKRLAEQGDVTRTLARLLVATQYRGPTEAREVRRIDAPKPRADRADRPERGARDAGPRPRLSKADFSAFRVSWGSQHGADPRRMLAMVCRWGGITNRDVGTIRIEATHSVIEVARNAAERFAAATSEPDPRNPRVRVRPERSMRSERTDRGERSERGERGPTSERPRWDGAKRERPRRRVSSESRWGASA